MPGNEAKPPFLPTSPDPVLYDVFLGNNDSDTSGMTPAEAIADISFELETAQSAVLLLRHGATKGEALRTVDALRWLVENSDLPQ